MRDNRDYELTDPHAIRRVLEEHPWALLVSAPSTGSPVVSHLPVLVEPGEPLSLLSHLGRPDEDRHELGRHEVLVVAQGPSGYVSPSWYGPGESVPTWNYVAVHAWGTPELLPHEENLDVLAATVDRFERDRPEPRSMADAGDYGLRIAHGTVGFRIRPTRVQAKAKLSQDKTAEVVERVVHALEHDPVHAQPDLAAAMRREHGLVPGAGGAR